jgi:hypothetical protein
VRIEYNERIAYQSYKYQRCGVSNIYSNEKLSLSFQTLFMGITSCNVPLYIFFEWSHQMRQLRLAFKIISSRYKYKKTYPTTWHDNVVKRHESTNKDVPDNGAKNVTTQTRSPWRMLVG